MTLTREDPQPLRPQVRSDALRTAFLMALTAAVFWAVTSYAGVVVQFLRGAGLRSRQIEPWRLPVMAILIGLPAWRTLSAAYELIRLSHRLRVARTWERQLDDPVRAAEVPPLGTHLIRTTRTTLRTAVGILAGSVLAALGSVGFAVGAAYGVLPLRTSEDAVGYSWLVAVASGWAIVRASKLLGEARGAAMVERLSSSGPLEVEQQSAARAQQVPLLTVHYAAALRPVPNRNAGRILYLRLFDNRAGTDEFVSRWRRYGVVHYLRSADQVSSDELKTWSGRVGDLSVFIDNDGELDDFLAGLPHRPWRHRFRGAFGDRLGGRRTAQADRRVRQRPTVPHRAAAACLVGDGRGFTQCRHRRPDADRAPGLSGQESSGVIGSLLPTGNLQA